MKKPTMFLVLLVVIATILIAGCTTQQPVTPTVTATPTASPAISAQEKACIDSGGNVTTMSCCTSASDFPNLCLIGACGCSPTGSHQITVCDCGTARCFNGTACVNS